MLPQCFLSASKADVAAIALIVSGVFPSWAELNGKPERAMGAVASRWSSGMVESRLQVNAKPKMSPSPEAGNRWPCCLELQGSPGFPALVSPYVPRQFTLQRQQSREAPVC